MLTGSCPCRTALRANLSCPSITFLPKISPLQQLPFTEHLLCAKLCDLVPFAVRLWFLFSTKETEVENDGPKSSHPCLAPKGRILRILSQSPINETRLRTPKPRFWFCPQTRSFTPSTGYPYSPPPRSLP